MMTYMHIKPVARWRGLKLLALVVSAFCLYFLPSASAMASYAIQYTAASGTNMQAGTVVVSNTDKTIRPAYQGEGKSVFGAVTAVPKDLLSPGSVGVVSSGVSMVLVSDIGGDIETGDRIVISPLEGVGMKVQQPGWIIGIAQTDFSSKAKNVTRQSVTSKNGATTTASIKAIPVLLSVSYYTANTGTMLVGPIQSTLNALVGHAVPTDRALAALIIFGIAVILLVAMVYSAVKNSLISVGRNPQAHSKISRSLVKVLLTALLVIILALGTIILILK